MEKTSTNVTYADESLRTVGLPKWPALVVSGKKVTEKQAAEILIRTDGYMPDYSYAGNDKYYAAEINEIFGLGATGYSDGVEEYRNQYAQTEELRERMGILPRLGYLANHQIISSWIGGPHGWCNWNGDIFSNNFNIGKWPSVESVAEEWGAIAEAFPFLELRAQLFKGETGDEDNEPIIEFVVANGKVEITEPGTQLAPPMFDMMGSIMRVLGDSSRERGIPVNSLKVKLQDVYGEIPQVKEKIDE